MKNLFICFVIILNAALYAQSNDTTANRHNIKFGTELDVFPFATGGYYGSLILGYDNLRLRAIYAKTNQPKFVLPDGFDKNKMQVYTILFDYFLNKNNEIKDWWVGVGFELWKNNVRNESGKTEKKFDTYIFTFGAGYVWYITKNIYLNPWGAGHLQIAGDKKVRVGSLEYKTKLILPEVSLKVGVMF